MQEEIHDDTLENDVAALTGCVSGTATVEAIEQLLAATGFEGVEVRVRGESGAFIRDWLPGSGVEEYVASATIEAVKPNRGQAGRDPEISA